MDSPQERSVVRQFGGSVVQDGGAKNVRRFDCSAAREFEDEQRAVGRGQRAGDRRRRMKAFEGSKARTKGIPEG